MPREGEPPKSAKVALKQVCKIRIIKPVPKEHVSRQTARLFWGCDAPDCNRTYTEQRNLLRHKKESHGPPEHQCPCGNFFKRLEYLISHQEKCRRRHAATQTDYTLDYSVQELATSFQPGITGANGQRCHATAADPN
jgi:hypothetical protein